MPLQSPPPPQSPQPPQKPRRGNKGVIAISLVVLLVILAGTAFAGFNFFTSRNSSTAKDHATTTPTALTTAATATPVATDTTTTQAGASLTPTDTTTTAITPTDTAATSTVTTTTTGDYTALQPGPGCDTSGGTWTPQDISSINCGTQLSVNGNTRGYLYLQLPNTKAFSASNIIGVSGNLGSGSPGYCVGLAEQGASTGYLVEYCADGSWFVYSISSGGAVVQTKAKSLTSIRTGEQLSLTIKGSLLSFSIDTEVHTIAITPIQPTRVAITFATGYYSSNVTVTNFSYTALA